MSNIQNLDLGEPYQKVFRITLALYRVTECFPHEEVLRRLLRESANEIFSGVSEYSFVPSEEKRTSLLMKLHTLKGFLEITRSLRLVNPLNIIVLEREYNTLFNFLSGEFHKKPSGIKRETMGLLEELPTWEEFISQETKNGAKNGPAITRAENEEISVRQSKIIEYLKKTPQAKLGDLLSLFDEVGYKTVQRDLHSLVIKDVLRKEGDRRWTVYSLK